LLIACNNSFFALISASFSAICFFSALSSAKLFKIFLISFISFLISSNSFVFISSISSSSHLINNQISMAFLIVFSSRLKASAFAGTATKDHSNNSDLVIFV
jgi:hypothetical protein